MDFNPYLIAKVQFISADPHAMNIDHNPNLKPWQASSPNNVAGKGQIEAPGKARNIVWQSRAAAPTDFENSLGDALEQVFTAGAMTPEEIVDGLNRIGLRQRDGQPWSVAVFESEMARLGV